MSAPNTNELFYPDSYQRFREIVTGVEPMPTKTEPVQTERKITRRSTQTPAAGVLERAYTNKARSDALVSDEGRACREYVAQCKAQGKPRPLAAELMQTWKLANTTVNRIIVAEYGVNRASAKATEARDWLATQTTPQIVSIVERRFGVSKATAQRIVRDHNAMLKRKGAK